MFFFRVFMLIFFMLFTSNIIAQEAVKFDGIDKQGYLHGKNLNLVDSSLSDVDVASSSIVLPDSLSKNVLSKPPELQGSSIAIKVILTLLGISLLIFGLAWLAKRLGVPGVTASSDMKVLTSLSLGQREKVILIEVLGEKILLGSTNSSINTLHVFNDNCSYIKKTLATGQEGNADVCQKEGELKYNDSTMDKPLDDNIVKHQPVSHKGLTSGCSLIKENIHEKNHKSDFSMFLKRIVASSLVSK